MEQLIVKRPMTVDIGDLTEDDIHSSLEPAEIEYVAIKMLHKNKVLDNQIYRLNKRNKEDQRELTKVIKAHDKNVTSYNALLKENEEIKIALRDLDDYVARKEAYYKKLDKQIEESNFITPADQAKAFASVAYEFDDTIDVESTEPLLTAKLCNNVAKEAKTGSSNANIGNKHGEGNINNKVGKSSKYRNVSFSKKDKTFTAQVKNEYRSPYIGSSKSELKCALMVDAHLDSFNDTKHIRNRDEHPEIMEAYKTQQEQEKKKEEKNVSK